MRDLDNTLAVMIQTLGLGFIMGTQAILLEKPSDTVVISGQRVVLFCSTTVTSVSDEQFRSVYWGYRRPGAAVVSAIFQSRVMVERFVGKFSVSDGISSGMWELHVINATLEDAGRYSCVDADRSLRNTDPNHHAMAELVVIDGSGMGLVRTSNISAEGIIPVGLFIGDFPLPPDHLSYNCSLSFRGNRVPPVRWKCGDNIVEGISSLSVVENSLATYSLVIQATKNMTGNNLVCETDFFQNQRFGTSPNDRLKRSLSMEKILDFSYNKSNGEAKKVEVPVIENCAVVTNVACYYKWVSERIKLEFPSKVLVLDTASELLRGVYRCKATCKLRSYDIPEVEANAVNVSYKEACKLRSYDIPEVEANAVNVSYNVGLNQIISTKVDSYSSSTLSTEVDSYSSSTLSTEVDKFKNQLQWALVWIFGVFLLIILIVNFIFMYKIYRTRREFSYPLPIHPVEMPFLFEEHNTAKFVQDTIDKIPDDTTLEECKKILESLKSKNLLSIESTA